MRKRLSLRANRARCRVYELALLTGAETGRHRTSRPRRKCGRARAQPPRRRRYGGGRVRRPTASATTSRPIRARARSTNVGTKTRGAPLTTTPVSRATMSFRIARRAAESAARTAWVVGFWTRAGPRRRTRARSSPSTRRRRAPPRTTPPRSSLQHVERAPRTTNAEVPWRRLRAPTGAPRGSSACDDEAARPRRRPSSPRPPRFERSPPRRFARYSRVARGGSRVRATRGVLQFVTPGDATTSSSERAPTRVRGRLRRRARAANSSSRRRTRRGESFGEASHLVGAGDASFQATTDASVLGVRRRGLEAIAARRPMPRATSASSTATTSRVQRPDAVIFRRRRDAAGRTRKHRRSRRPRTTTDRWSRCAGSTRVETTASRTGIRSRSASEDAVVRSPPLAVWESSTVAAAGGVAPRRVRVARSHASATGHRCFARARALADAPARKPPSPPPPTLPPLYAILEGEAELADDDDDVESESSSRRVLTRGDAFGESPSPAGRTRDARRWSRRSVFRDARSRFAPRRWRMMPPSNAARFLPAAAAAVAAKDDRTTTTSERSETSEARVARVAASIRRLFTAATKTRRSRGPPARPQGVPPARRRPDAVPGRVRRARERRRVRVRRRDSFRRSLGNAD